MGWLPRPGADESRLGRGDDVFIDLSKKKSPVEEPVVPSVVAKKPKVSGSAGERFSTEDRSRGGKTGGKSRWAGVSKEERSELVRKGWETRRRKKVDGDPPKT